MVGVQRRHVALRTIGSLAGGAAVGAAFPPLGQWELMPLGIAVLVIVVRGRSAAAGLGYGWLFGTAFMAVLMPWIRVIGYDAWIALSVIEGFFYGLMGLSWAVLTRRAWWPAAIPASWVGAEFLRGAVPFGGLPWGRLAFGLVDTPMDRYGRLGGSALVSYVVVLVVALVVDAVLLRRTVGRAVVESAAAVALVLVALVLPVGLAGPAGAVTVAAVQGNVPGQGLNAFAQRHAVLRNHATATRALAAAVAAGRRPRPDFVIWPENASDIDPFANRQAYREIAGAVDAVGVPVLVGVVLDGPGPDHVQNVGIVWSPVSGPGQRYVKQHLVPFGEYIPFRRVLTRYIGRLNEIPKDFAPGHRAGVLRLGGTTAGDLMCFEVAYDGLVRAVVDDGAQLVVVQTNNATYAGSGQLAQQFAISRYRAIESGREVVVASTDGISGYVSASGAVLAASRVHTQVVFDRTVELARAITPGMRFGLDVDVALSVGALLLTLLAALAGRRRARQDGPVTAP